MICPRKGCEGAVEGPQYENTTQGRVYTMHCLNCGWRANDSILAIPTESVPRVFPRCSPDVRRAPKPQVVYRKRFKIDLSKYEFEPGDRTGPQEREL